MKSGDKAGSIVSSGKTSYRIIKIDGVRYPLHVVLWVMTYSQWPKKDLDHIDHNGLNNVIKNLREVLNFENCANRRGADHWSASHFKGVSLADKKYWCARIGLHSHVIRLGCFPLQNERDAARTYDRAAILAFGEFAHTNFPAHESEHVILSERVLNKIQGFERTDRIPAFKRR